MPASQSAYRSDELPGKTVDAVVVGGGAAGLNGALMLARSRRSVVVVDSGTPRNAPAEGVHGLLGLDGTPPAELLERGRDEVRRFGGTVQSGEVVKAAADPSAGGDLRFSVALADGGTLRARRLLVATGSRDVLPDVSGLAEHWGHSVVHCPYCHGWEVRDEPIGVLAVGPTSIHQAILFRQLTDNLVYFTSGTRLDRDTRERFAARNICLVDTPVDEVVTAEGGGIAGVRLTDGRLIRRRVLAVATTMQARTEGLEDLGLPMQDLPNGMGRHFATGMAGTTQVRGVWVAGNATDLTAQVGASAAAGALAGAHMNADLATADTEAALTTVHRDIAHTRPPARSPARTRCIPIA
ncbi:NAD(P)/FAD-dependent oxidoreductase [Actinomadura geliboluensis]|uniref:NAD(P)/FAD-dependent oxidoreductase n=1 Tax=Actinomadura geliboluensis TaxID=882440 RepID=A0A5S4H9Q4_9ACTN|nr:NAD(P)/FAD-dependent oxidoreductase [Actinomadura geliboluensis]TMR41706.1 NAD(P)/FAD-dependent oxidoreductase [Actinomadura geliboluensis]